LFVSHTWQHYVSCAVRREKHVKWLNLPILTNVKGREISWENQLWKLQGHQGMWATD
jgi:hypothetical protein